MNILGGEQFLDIGKKDCLKVVKRKTSSDDANFSCDMHPVMQQVYLGRDVHSGEELGEELKQLPDPSELKGVDQAIALLCEALHKDQSIIIVGDFDADGATGTALTVMALRDLGFKHVDFAVPDRFRYGYGLSVAMVETLALKKPSLILTVDNGITSFEGVDKANELGMKVIITDHHECGDKLPAAAAIINPQQSGCKFPSKALAGVGVVFFLLLALRRTLRTEQWFDKNGVAEPEMGKFLDLVALGTVADMVPLDKCNRILVSSGLARIRSGLAHPGIAALFQVAKRPLWRAIAEDLGFAVAPRLNAAGRLENMATGIFCLMSPDLDSAERWGQSLNGYNQKRRVVSDTMEAQAFDKLNKEMPEYESCKSICLFDPDWHEGVTGLLASRVKDVCRKPTIILTRATDGYIKGSIRSVTGVHIRDALVAVDQRFPNLLLRFGGHAMAAGLTLANDDVKEFHRAFEEVVSEFFTATTEEQLLIDCELSPMQLDTELAQEIRYGGPWGRDFPEPLFEGVFDIISQRIVGKGHRLFSLAFPDTDERIKAIVYCQRHRVCAPVQSKRMNIIYRIQLDYFRGQEDICLVVEQLNPL